MPWIASSRTAILVGVLATALGLLFIVNPSKSVYNVIGTLSGRLAAKIDRSFIGLTPFHMPMGEEWPYTLNDLYNSNKFHRLKGQTAIVTGANAGVGYEKSLALGRLGASVTLACRNEARCKTAAQSIVDDSAYGGGTIRTMIVDTSSLTSVKEFCEKYIALRREEDNVALASLDMLFLNAGIAEPTKRNKGDRSHLTLTEDGIETVFATNYVGHHLMYRLLEPLILQSKIARVVVTSSAASFDLIGPHKVATSLEVLNSNSGMWGSFTAWHLYTQSKLAQILWVKELTSRLSSSFSNSNNNDNNVYVNAYHPGAVNTGIWGKNTSIPKIVRNTILKWVQSNLMWTAEQGALTGLYLGIETEDLVQNNIRGKYFHPQVQEVVNHFADDEPLQKKLWSFTDELVSDYL